MQTPIPNEELESLLVRVKAQMFIAGFSQSIIDGTRIVATNPNYWEVSIFVPYEKTKASVVRRQMENILFNICGIDSDCCDYFGKQKEERAYEWYFRHPNIPQDIADLIEAEIDAERGSEKDTGIPSPSGNESKIDTVFLSLKDKYFKAIQIGEKTTEYRNLNQYYCDKFFSPGVKKRFVKFNRGYLSGAENQMVFEIADIVFVNKKKEEFPTRDVNGNPISSDSQLPSTFSPVMYGIKLGNRIS